jgi:hypothetical protein
MTEQRQEQDFERVILTLLEICADFAVLEGKTVIKIYLKGENKTSITLNRDGKWNL